MSSFLAQAMTINISINVIMNRLPPQSPTFPILDDYIFVLQGTGVVLWRAGFVMHGEICGL